FAPSGTSPNGRALALAAGDDRARLRPPPLFARDDDADERDGAPLPEGDGGRRALFRTTLSGGSAAVAALSWPGGPALAANAKSRTEGYEVRKTDAEWSESLTSTQYFVLRRGGTESPYSSILEGEDRPGTFACAGCGTALFDASQKFHSGTGWPSFAAFVDDRVETERVSQIQYQLGGAEVRCATCGGHLGDIFADGFLFPGTPAFATGKRYCIDGAALVFLPREGREGEGGGAEA
ncbi:hypothetical protein ACHAWF_000669, partial [Thalassiosira exigua]